MVLPMRRVVSNLVFATFTIAIGCIIGWSFSLGRAPPVRPSDSSASDRQGFHQFISKQNMKDALYEVTQKDFNPGDENASGRFVFNITRGWEDMCDEVIYNFYRVMVSLPISTTIKDDQGTILINRSSADPYIAWSSDCDDLIGEVVNKNNPMVENRFCYAHVGQKSVSELALEAERANCTGLFTVPDLKTFEDLDENDTQYGSAHYLNGDISTDAVIPSNNINSIRKTVEELKKEGKIPKIPIIPLSNADFDRVSGKTITIDVKTNTDLAEIQTPACFFFGSTVQENIILVGSQMDAFAQGVKDAKTGLVIQKELIKSISEMKKGGWSNKRTIVFPIWPASLLGLIGTVEFHQEYRATVEQMAMAYISLDQAVVGTDICLSRGSPLFNTIATFVAEEIDWQDCPISSGKDCTLLQNWEERYQRLDRSPFPKFEPVNVNGNFEPFFQSSGVPTLAFHCFDEGWNPNYPHFHSTAFTSKDSVDNFLELDKDLDVLASLAKYVLSVIEVLAGHTIVNFDVNNYCERIYLETIILNDRYSMLTKMNRNTQFPSINGILDSAKDLVQQGREYQDLIMLITSSEDFTEQDTTIRYINSLERIFERNFVEQKSGVNGEHVIYGSKSKYTRSSGIYQLEGFGQLLRIFEKIDEHRGGNIPENLLTTLQNEFDIVQYHLQQAHNVLDSFTRIMINYN